MLNHLKLELEILIERLDTEVQYLPKLCLSLCNNELDSKCNIIYDRNNKPNSDYILIMAQGLVCYQNKM